jgi:hypothetical protein
MQEEFNTSYLVMVSTLQLTQPSTNDIGSSTETYPSIDFSMQSAITTGLSAPEQDVQQQLNYKCLGSDCTWDPFLTLGVCSSCIDVSSHLTKIERGYLAQNRSLGSLSNGPDTSNSAIVHLQGVDFGFNVRKNFTATKNFTDFALPNGLYLEDYGNFTIDMVSFATSERNETIAFQDNDTLLWALTIIRRDSSSELVKLSNLIALECGLTYCVQNISARVVDSTLWENTTTLPIQQSDGSFRPEHPGAPDSLPTSLWKPDDSSLSDLQLMGNSNGFNITSASINSIATFLNTTFIMPRGRKLGATGFYMPAPPKLILQQTEEGDQKLDQAPQYQPTVMQQLYNSDIPKTFETLAKSMSINMRNNDDKGSLHFGSTSVPVYKVRWEWITLPILTLLTSTVFLFLTIRSSTKAKAPLWKGSALAVLKVGVQVGDVLADEETITAMEKKAEKARVGLGEGQNNVPGKYPVLGHCRQDSYCWISFESSWGVCGGEGSFCYADGKR